MESTPEFAQEIEDGQDPFAGTDFGDFETEPEAPADTAGLPVVNKEGERIEPTVEGGLAPGTPEAAPSPLQTPPPGPTDPAAEAEAYREQHAAAPPAATAPEAAPAPPQEPASPAPEPAPTPAPAAESEPESAPDPQPASTPEPQASAEEPEDAEAPQERQSGGKTTHRRYVVLRVTGPGKFEQVLWHENAEGKMVPKGTPGSKRQTIALARGTEDALKIGFLACGAPQDGVTLIAVAAAYFSAKPVKPKPPEPTRQRLQIG